MSTAELLYLLVCGAAALAVLGPQRRRPNVNPRPTYKRPPAPPGPPPVQHNVLSPHSPENLPNI